MRTARVCYNHLAGTRGVQMYEALLAKGVIVAEGDDVQLTPTGERFATDFGIDLTALGKSKVPLCRSCLDWSERRNHLAGSLGRAILSRMEDQTWVRRDPKSRAVVFSPQGLTKFEAVFGFSAAHAES
jgi:hypothetical protein